MTGITVTYRVRTWKERHGRAVIAEGASTAASSGQGKPAAPAPPPRAASKAARTLALAHHIERLIEAGVLENYADAARRMGVSRARISQITRLLVLPIVLQEAALAKVNPGGPGPAQCVELLESPVINYRFSSTVPRPQEFNSNSRYRHRTRDGDARIRR